MDLQKAPRWIEWTNELISLFMNDPDIEIHYDNKEHEIKIDVNNNIKADALTKLLPFEKEFDEVTLKIIVNSKEKEVSATDLYRMAFLGNPVVKQILSPQKDKTYIVFEKKIVQFFNNDPDDVYGNKTLLYQTIAKDIFDSENIFFCTDADEEAKRPWPPKENE